MKRAVVVGALVTIAACGGASNAVGPTATTTAAPSPSTGPQATVPPTVRTTTTLLEPSGTITLSPATATSGLHCLPPEFDDVICEVKVTNNTHSVGMMTTDAAFYDAQGTRVGTDGRYQDYVRPGESYIASHFGPAQTTSAKILGVALEVGKGPNVGSIRASEDGALLPVDKSVISLACTPNPGDDTTCDATLVNTGPFVGEVTTEVAFFDAGGVRVESESRYQELVPPGERYLQTFYGTPETVRMEVLEMELVK